MEEQLLKKKKHLPVQGISTIKEEDSRIEFKRRIHPWKFVPFGQTHAAVDGTVETSYEDSTKTMHLVKKFLITLGEK